MKSKSKLNELWLVKVFGAEWAYVIFYALFGLVSITLPVFLIGWHYSYWFPSVGGLLLGVMYGWDRACNNPETLAHYVGVRSLFPRLVRKYFAQANGGEFWGMRSRGDARSVRLISAVRWESPAGLGKHLASGGGRNAGNTFVPEDVFVSYMKQHFVVEVHTVCGDPKETSYQTFYFLKELQPLPKDP